MVHIDIYEKTNYYNKENKIVGEIFEDERVIIETFEVDESDIPADGLPCLEYFVKEICHSDEMTDILYRIKNECKDITINGNLFKWDEIKHILNYLFPDYI